MKWFLLILFGSLLTPNVAFSQDDKFDQDFMDMVFQKSRERREEKKQKDSALAVLKRFDIDRENVAAAIEMSDSQNQDLQEIRKIYSDKVVSIAGEVPGWKSPDFDQILGSKDFKKLDTVQRDLLRELRGEFAQELFDLFLPSQLSSLRNFHTGVGIPRLLLESPAGAMLELSDQQRERIRTRSDRLHAELEVMIRRAREESRAIIEEELTDLQLKRLENVFGKKQLDKYPGNLPVDVLYLMHYFEKKKGNEK